LMLDEPTNDLDVDTLARLEDLLDGWPGTLVVVSHDRYLVERVCDTVVALLGDGKVTHLPGGIEEYLARRGHGAERRSGVAAAPGGRGGGARGVGAASGAPARGANARDAAAGGGPARSGAEQRAARKEAARLERRLETLTAREKALHDQMVEAATEPERLLALDAELRGVVAEREDVELEWLAAAEAAE